MPRRFLKHFLNRHIIPQAAPPLRIVKSTALIMLMKRSASTAPNVRVKTPMASHRNVLSVFTIFTSVFTTKSIRLTIDQSEYLPVRRRHT